MKSKISCWRFVRFSSTISGRLLEAGCDCVVRTCVRRLAPSPDGCKGSRDPAYNRLPRACGGIGRRARLRALWGVSPVGVRVSLGALLQWSSLRVRESPRCESEKRFSQKSRSAGKARGLMRAIPLHAPGDHARAQKAE